MESSSPSRTALLTALMRSLHGRLDPRPLLQDPWGDSSCRTVCANGSRGAQIAEKTVRNHMNHIFSKLGVGERSHLIDVAPVRG